MGENGTARHEREWMTLEECLAKWGIGLTQGYELARRDALPIPAVRIGRQYRFSRALYERHARGEYVRNHEAA